ncbi:MAG: flagellar biosynthetic protein FliR [bacterium]|nr:flagellar biosynthetic protein FliR [bacterium]
METLVFEVEIFKVFALVMARFAGLMVSAPVLGSRNFPIRAKAGVAAMMAVLVVPTIATLDQPLPSGAMEFGVFVLGETLIGLMIGFVLTLVFAAVQVAGQIVDMLSGFALMNVFNPALETQVPVFGFFYYVVAALFLLAINGHHLMIQGLVATFETIPLGGFAIHPALLREASTWGSDMFYYGLLIATPPAGALMLAYVSMGLMGRVVPQIHLFVVGFPVTIALGLLTVALALQSYIFMLDGMFYRMFKNVETLIEGMA